MMSDEPKITPNFAAKVAKCPKCHSGVRGWCNEHGAEFARTLDGLPIAVRRGVTTLMENK